MLFWLHFPPFEEMMVSFPFCTVSIYPHKLLLEVCFSHDSVCSAVWLILFEEEESRGVMGAALAVSLPVGDSRGGRAWRHGSLTGLGPVSRLLSQDFQTDCQVLLGRGARIRWGIRVREGKVAPPL